MKRTQVAGWAAAGVLTLLVCAGARGQPAQSWDTALWETATEAGRQTYAEGRYADAEKRFAQALALAETFDAQDTRRAVSLTNLGSVYQSQGRYADAEVLYRRALAMWNNPRRL